jgi:8-oxo-dGTP diphosphatase
MERKYAGVTADTIINYKDQGIILIRRKNNPFQGMWAIPGGFLEVGSETLVEAAARELEEETHLISDPAKLTYLGVYDDPKRDPRGPIISHAFYGRVSEGAPKADDDAKEIDVFSLKKLPPLAFDHSRILEDYKNAIEKGGWRSIQRLSRLMAAVKHV